MASKTPPATLPTNYDSSDGDEEYSSRSEDEEQPQQKSQHAEAVMKKPSSSEDEDEDDNSSEFEDSADGEDFNQIQNTPSRVSAQPIVHKSPEPNTSKSKFHVKKRQSEPLDDHEVVSKKKKGKISAREEMKTETKKGAAGTSKNIEEGGVVIEEKKSTNNNNRLFSDEDEIGLLEGFFDFKSKNGYDPSSNRNAFLEYVNPKLSVDFTKIQLYEKVRRLKNKFFRNAEKFKNNGQACVFTTTHEQKLYQLSHKIWGDYSVTQGNLSKVKTTKKKDNKETIMEEEAKEEEETQDFWSLYPRLFASIESEASSYLTIIPGDSKEFAKQKICALGKDNAKKLEEQWKAFHVMEYELYAKRMQLTVRQNEVVSDVIEHLNI